MVKLKTENEQMTLLEKLKTFIKRMFSWKPQKALTLDENREIHLEPKYWPEVMDFIEQLNDLVDTHTIEDNNIRRVNQRIITYIEDQINHKGQLEDLESRYMALNTLADRILSHHLSKIVGIKESTSSTADFSEAVRTFKERLAQKLQAEAQK